MGLPGIWDEILSLGVLDGSLDASAFDARQIQDAYWEKSVAKLYKDICQNTDCTAQLSQLFEDVSDSYAAAAKEKLKTHRMKLSEITPTNGSKVHPPNSALPYIASGIRCILGKRGQDISCELQCHCHRL